MAEALTECPQCDGQPVYTVHGPGLCSLCKGSGRVTFRVWEAYNVCRARYKDRVNRGLSLWEEAARLGITPRELSDMEHYRG